MTTKADVWAAPRLWWRVLTVVVTVAGLLIGNYTPVWFTSQSMIAMTVYLVVTIHLMLRDGTLDQPAPRLRGAITTYVMTTGLVSHFINGGGASPFPGLSDPDVALRIDNWSVFLIHYIAPILFVLDWLLFGPHAVRWRDALLWVLYPLGYAAVMLTRGLLFPPLDPRFPYFFVDPITDGWGTMLVGMAQVLAFVIVIALVVIGTGKLSDRLRGIDAGREATASTG